MKTGWAILCMFLFTGKTVFAQMELTGRILDQDQNPIEFATITLLNPVDSAMIKGTISDSTGLFSIIASGSGTYLVRVSSLGMRDFVSEHTLLPDQSGVMDLGNLVLTPVSSELADVIVKGKTPFIVRKPDRLVVNVAESITGAGASVLDVLRQSPNVHVDQDGNISLRGRQGVIVMMDGKRLRLGGNELANMLRGMPSSSLETIEIITNPPASYDAEGSSGIIDLKTLKGKYLGFNGNAAISAGYGKYSKATASVNINNKGELMHLYGSYNYSYNKVFNNLIVRRHFADTTYQSLLYDQNSLLQLPYNTHRLQAGADFALSESTTIGVLASGHANLFDPKGDNTTTILHQSSEVGGFTTTNRSEDEWYNGALNFNVKHKIDTLGRTISADLDYARYWNSTHQLFTTEFEDIEIPPSVRDYLKGDIGGNLNLYSAKVDLAWPLAGFETMEAGLKSSWVDTDNDLKYFVKENGQVVFDPGQSNHFLYEENINAGYLTWTKETDKWQFKAGARAEQTRAEGLQLTTDSAFHRNYWQIFPSAFVNYTFSGDHSGGLSVSRRINRPNYNQLNPFRAFVDLTTFREGNPFLLPELSWSFELTYSFKQRYHLSMSYVTTQDNLSSVLLQNDEEKYTIVKFINLDRYRYFGLNLNTPFQPAKWWDLRSDLNIYYHKFEGNVGSAGLNNSGPAFHVNINNTFSLPAGITFELSGMYMHRHVYNISTIKPIWSINAGLQKPVLGDLGMLRLNIRDIFWRGWPAGSTEFDNIRETFESRRETRVATLSFSYKFGKQTVGASRTRQSGAAEEMRRAGRG